MTDTVCQLALQAIQDGKDPLEFVKGYLGSSYSADAVQGLAEELCQKLGIDLPDLLNKLLGSEG